MVWNPLEMMNYAQQQFDRYKQAQAGNGGNDIIYNNISNNRTGVIDTQDPRQYNPMSGQFQGGTGLSGAFAQSDPTKTALTPVQIAQLQAQGRIQIDPRTGEYIVDGQRMTKTDQFKGGSADGGMNNYVPASQRVGGGTDPTRPASAPPISGLTNWRWNGNTKSWVGTDPNGRDVIVNQDAKGQWGAKEYVAQDTGTGLNKTSSGGLNYGSTGGYTNAGAGTPGTIGGGGSTGTGGGTSTGTAGDGGFTGYDYTPLGAPTTINDPQLTAAKARLEQAMASGPYSQEVQSNLISQQSDMNAAAAAARGNAMRTRAGASGASLTDPSLGAAQDEIMAARQAANSAAARDIQTKAQLANWEGQNQAAGQLAGVAMQQGAFNANAQNQAQQANWQGKNQAGQWNAGQRNQWNQWSQDRTDNMDKFNRAIQKHGTNFWLNTDTRAK